MRLGLIAREALERACEDNGFASNRAVTLHRFQSLRFDGSEQAIKLVLVMLLGEKVRHCFRDHITNAANILDLLARYACCITRSSASIAQSFKRFEVTCKTLGICFTHMANTEREDKTVERDFASGINRSKEIAHRCLTKALEIAQAL